MMLELTREELAQFDPLASPYKPVTVTMKRRRKYIRLLLDGISGLSMGEEFSPFNFRSLAGADKLENERRRRRDLIQSMQMIVDWEQRQLERQERGELPDGNNDLKRGLVTVRMYASNAEKQKAYRERKAIQQDGQRRKEEEW